MGLISTEVEVTMIPKNITYYYNLGYEIPKIKTRYGVVTPRNTKITVKVTDLSSGSHVPVIVKCDCCGKIYEIKYQTYHNHNCDGKYYCHSCANFIFNSGENNHSWNPNKTDDERLSSRDYPEYKNFIKRVLARDNYTCQCCGITNCKLSVHHLDGYNWYKEGRIDDKNAITLCENCHNNFHYKYGKGNNTKSQFDEWYGKTVEDLQEYNGVLQTTRKVFDYEEQKIYNGAYEYASLHNCAVTSVYDCCNHRIVNYKYINKNGKISFGETKINSVLGHHLLWLDEYEKISKQDLEIYLQQSIRKSFTKVICITTGIIFDSIKEASNYYKVHRACIGDCCKGRQKTAGKLNGIPLKWMYLSDFKKLPQEEQEKILANVKEELL